MRHRTTAVALAALLATVLAACGSGPGAGSAPSTDTTVDVRLVLEPTSLDLT